MRENLSRAFAMVSSACVQMSAYFIYELCFIEQNRGYGFPIGMEKTVDPIIEAFATVLRKRRSIAGLSQEELAARAGVSMRFVSTLEGAKYKPTILTMQKLATALEIPLSEMIREAEGIMRA